MRRHDVQAIAKARQRSVKPLIFGLVAVLGLLVLTACGAGGTASPEDGNSGPDGLSLDVPDLAVQAYQGVDVLGGTDVLLSEVLAEGKPVVLNFWAALCPPCRAEMPDFQEIYEERGDEFVLLGIDIGPFQLLGTRQEGRNLLRQLELTYPAGTTFDEGIMREYQILGMPTTYFIASDGSVVSRFAGLLTKQKMNELLDEAIAGSL